MRAGPCKCLGEAHEDRAKANKVKSCDRFKEELRDKLDNTEKVEIKEGGLLGRVESLVSHSKHFRLDCMNREVLLVL